MKLLSLVVALATLATLGAMLTAPPRYERAPILAAVVDGGTMEAFLDDASEKDALLDWVERGAPEDGWEPVSRILEARCASCHHASAPLETLPLDAYATAAEAARVRPVLLEKITGGTMGKYLASREEQSTLTSWMASGAGEAGWPAVEAVLYARCVSCHSPDGVSGLVSIEVYPSVRRLAALPPPATRPLWAPGLVLAASLIALVGAHRRRRT